MPVREMNDEAGNNTERNRMGKNKKNDDRLPRITLVTPSYNQSRFLEKTILSVLSQDYEKLEYFVMDGGSTDGSKELIQRYSEKITYWQSRSDGGQGDAILNGWTMGSGELLGWINSDDLLMPGALRKIANAYLQTQSEIVTGEEIGINEHDEIISYALKWRGPLWMYKAALIHPGQPGTFFERKCAEKAGYFNPRLRCAMEFELVMKMLRVGAEIEIVDTPVACLRQHSETKSRNLSTVFRAEKKKIFEKYATYPFSNDTLRTWMTRALRYPYGLRYLKPKYLRETKKKIKWMLRSEKL